MRYKKEIIRAAIFAAGIALMNALLGAAYSEKMASSLRERSEREFESFQKNISVLVMGDSHAFRGLNPEILGPDSFNYAHAGESYAVTYYRLKYLVDKDVKSIDTVIIPLDLHSFSSFRAGEVVFSKASKKFLDPWELGEITGRRAYYAFKYLAGTIVPYSGRPEVLFEVLEPKKEVFLDKDEMGRRQKKKLKRAGGQNADEVETRTIRGFAPDILDLSKNKAKMRMRIAEKRAAQHFENARAFDESLFSYLEKILELCRARGKKCVLLEYPVTEEYFMAASKYIPDMAAYEAGISAARAKYPEVEVLDFQKEFFGRPEMFADSDHLNKRGADELSGLVKRCLKLPDDGGL